MLSILNIVLMYVVEDESLDTVLLAMNVLLTVILFADFVYRLLHGAVAVATTSSASSAGPTCWPACPCSS